MTDVLHGNSGGNQLNAAANRTQVYGLSGNDTLTSDGKSNVLLIGGSGDDSLIMQGGNGTLSGGAGKDTFELNYSAAKSLSAVIEDFVPSEDKIIVNFAGNTAPQLSSSISGNDVIFRDGDGLLNVTLKGVRDNDYFDGDASDEAWEILKLTNDEREKKNLPALTMSDGLTTAAEIRVQEIAELGEEGQLDIFKHDRPENLGGYSTVFDEVGKHYSAHAENITAGESTAAKAVADWMGSPVHKKNILDEENRNYSKLGVGYKYLDSGSLSSQRYYWEQLFGSTLYSPAPETVNVSTATLEVHTVSKAVTLTEGNDTYSNSTFGATIAALGGNDLITNTGFNVSINGGADNDTIDNRGSFATINAGTGNDLIQLGIRNEELVIEYALGDGNDTVSGLNSSDTLSISGDEFTPATVGNNVVVAVGDDSITLVDAAKLSTLNLDGKQGNLIRGTERADNITNTDNGKVIAALGGNDTIQNSGSNVSINAGTGDDSISSRGNNVTFFHEGGNDTISGFYSDSTLKVAGGSWTSLISNDYYYNTLILIDSESGDSINLLNAGYYSPINIVDANGNPVTVGNAKDIRGTEGADSITNTFAYATIRALGGDDTITNSGYDVTIDAGAGDDSITNSNNYVTVNANAGDDSITNSGTNTSISGGDGNDSVDNNAAQVTISGGAGDDYVNNNQQLLTTYIYSGGNDTVEGFNASDSLNIGGYSYSTVSGEDGNIIVNVTRGSTTVGTVTLKDYSGQYVNIVSTYAPSTVRGRTISNANDSVSVTGSAGNDTITNNGASVTITGGKGNDQISLSGGASNNRIQYGAGDGYDTVNGFNATSTLQIGDGSSTYSTVESGSDVIVRVGNGSVLLDNAASLGASLNVDGVESSSSDTIIPLTEGDDTYSNYDSDVTILALGGDDYVYSNSDNVSIDGGADNDTISFNGINVTVTGGNGNDLIYENSPISTYIYTGGNDTIRNFERWSTLVIADSYSTQRNDRNVIIAVSGKGSITLTDYWDNLNIVKSLDDVTHFNIFRSGSDNTLITGTSDADYFGVWNDSVTVDAQDGDDFFELGEANISLNGGAGDDTVHMQGAANVTIDGGTGRNIFKQWWGSAGTAYVYGGGNDTIEGYNQHQTLVIADSWSSVRNGNTTIINVKDKGTITINGWWDDINIVSSVAEAKRYNFIRNNDSYTTVTGTGGDDFIQNNSGGSNVAINLAGGNDVVNNWGYYSTINGGAGTDSINNHSGYYSTINGGDGDDTLNNNNGTSNVVLNGDAGNDQINNNNRGSFVTMNGDTGNDYLWNSGANVTINGGEDNDTIYSYGSYNSSIDGGNGNDYILQGWHSDDSIFGDFSTLIGGDGDDIVGNYGGKNASILGGNGNDSIENGLATTWNNTTQQDETVSSPDNATIDGGAGNDNIYNNGASVSIDGGAGDDTVWNYSDGNNVSINGDAGNDWIYNYGDSVSIDGGAGNDYLDNTNGNNVSISGGDGTDTVWNNGSGVSIDGNAGNDGINNAGANVSINGGDGADTINNYSGSNVTMLGGAGDDRISLSSSSRNNLGSVHTKESTIKTKRIKPAKRTSNLS